MLLGLTLGTTAASHLFGQYFFQGTDFTGAEALWGNVSDWFSGVVGVSIGLAGSSIAIWLAYRVEKLTIAQNQMANVQAWRETYIDSGDIAARAELARHAYETMQKIYTSLVAIEKIDKRFDLENGGPISEEGEGGKTKKDVEDAKLKAQKEGEPHSEDILSAVKSMVALVPKLRHIETGTEDVLGIAKEELNEIAKTCMGSFDIGAKHSHRLAERILDKAAVKVHISDALNLFLQYTSASQPKMGQAADQSQDMEVEDFSEFYWESNAESAGTALQRFACYLPTAARENQDTASKVQWILALCDFVMHEVNPYRYAHDAIVSDLQVGDVNDRQEKRLTLLSNHVINNILPSSHYIHELFPVNGYTSDKRSKTVVVPAESAEAIEGQIIQAHPRVNLKGNQGYQEPQQARRKWYNLFWRQ